MKVLMYNVKNFLRYKKMTPDGSPAKFEKYEEKVKNLVKDAVDQMDGDGEDKLTKEEKSFQKNAFEKLNAMGIKKRLKVMIDTQVERDELLAMIKDAQFESFATYVAEDSKEDHLQKEDLNMDIEKTKLMPAKDLLRKSPAELQSLFMKKNGKIDFHGNSNAEYHIGLGDLLEPSQVWVKVDGVLGKRSFSGKKVGYLTSASKYLPIFGGEKIELLEDKDVTAAEKKSYEKIVPARDEKGLKSAFLKDVISFGEPEENIDNGENMKGNQLWRSEKFQQKTKKVADDLGIPKNYLKTIFFSESGCNPKAVNRAGGATGLIQFMPRTAAGLGTSVAEIRSMSGVDQLDYVYKYFSRYKGEFQSVEQMYLYTFYPAAMPYINDPNYVFGSEKNPAYARKLARVNQYPNKYATMAEFKQRVSNKKKSFV